MAGLVQLVQEKGVLELPAQRLCQLAMHRLPD